MKELVRCAEFPEDASTGLKVLWILRAWYWRFPLAEAKDMDYWEIGLCTSHSEILTQRPLRIRCWQFLEPLFEAYGYKLYRSNAGGCLFPPQDAVTESSFPFARRHYKNAESGYFLFGSWKVFMARDRGGRDVALRLISCSKEPSTEQIILEKFNQEPLRSHPHNRVIQVLDTITFGNFTFIVMPRWEGLHLFWRRFPTLSELLPYVQSVFECLSLLHENRIAHNDLLVQNTGINLLIDQDEPPPSDAYDPSIARYALYDFEGSYICPADIPLEDAVVEECGTAKRYNPFHADVFKFGREVFSSNTKLIENAPELKALFECMIDPEPGRRPNAKAVVSELCRLGAVHV